MRVVELGAPEAEALAGEEDEELGIGDHIPPEQAAWFLDQAKEPVKSDPLNEFRGSRRRPE